MVVVINKEMSGTHPQLVLVIVSIVQVDDVAMTELVENFYLHSEVWQLLVTLDGTDLGRGEPPVIFLPGFVDLTKGSVPELTDYIPKL